MNFREFLQGKMNESKDGQYVIVTKGTKAGNKFAMVLEAGPFNTWNEVQEYKKKHGLSFGLNAEHNTFIISKGDLYTVHHSTREAANLASPTYTAKNLEHLKAELGL